MRISDWSSDVCSSDLPAGGLVSISSLILIALVRFDPAKRRLSWLAIGSSFRTASRTAQSIFRSEEHTSELQSLMRISYAVFCLKKKKKNITQTLNQHDRVQTTIKSTNPSTHIKIEHNHTKTSQ